jgi:hypothetical protein
MFASVAPFRFPLVIPPRSVLDSRSRQKFTTFWLRSTASTIGLIRPFYTRIVGDYVVRYQTGYFASAILPWSSKLNSRTPTVRGGNFVVFTYPYSVISPSPEYLSSALKSVGVSIPT